MILIGNIRGSKEDLLLECSFSSDGVLGLLGTTVDAIGGDKFVIIPVIELIKVFKGIHIHNCAIDNDLCTLRKKIIIRPWVKKKNLLAYESKGCSRTLRTSRGNRLSVEGT